MAQTNQTSSIQSTGLRSDEAGSRGAQSRHILKAMRRARYERRYARHAPAPVSQRDRSDIPVRDPRCVIRGVPEYLQAVVRGMFGAPGTWGHGRYPNATKKGPGRRRIPLSEQNKPAGNKLSRRFFEKLS